MTRTTRPPTEAVAGNRKAGDGDSSYFSRMPSPVHFLFGKAFRKFKQRIGRKTIIVVRAESKHQRKMRLMSAAVHRQLADEIHGKIVEELPLAPPSLRLWRMDL